MIDELGVGVGQRIKLTREKKGMSQNDLHVLTGISTTQLSNYENGKRNIGLISIGKIAQALDCTIDELFFGEPSLRPISKAGDKNEMIVNCFCALVNEGVIGHTAYEVPNRYHNNRTETVTLLTLVEYSDVLEDLYKKLKDFEENKENYPDPASFKRQLLCAAKAKLQQEVDYHRRREY